MRHLQLYLNQMVPIDHIEDDMMLNRAFPESVEDITDARLEGVVAGKALVRTGKSIAIRPELFSKFFQFFG